MKRFLSLSLLAGFLCSCTEHVYTHRNTSVYQKAAPSGSVRRTVSSGNEAPAARVLPYTPEVVDAIRAE